MTKRPDVYYTAAFADLLMIEDEKHRPAIDGGTGFDLRFGYHHTANNWGYEVRAFHGSLEPVDPILEPGNRSGLGVNAVYRFPRVISSTVYVLAGVGAVYNDLLPGADWVAPYVDVGLGFVSGSLVELWERPLRLRAEGRYSYEDYRDDYEDVSEFDRSNYFDLRAFFGIELALTRRVPETAPAAPEVVPPVAPEDSDRDGVADEADRCPETAPGAAVDATGCAT